MKVRKCFLLEFSYSSAVASVGSLFLIYFILNFVNEVFAFLLL